MAMKENTHLFNLRPDAGAIRDPNCATPQKEKLANSHLREGSRQLRRRQGPSRRCEMSQTNSMNPAIKRIREDVKELRRHPSNRFV